MQFYVWKWQTCTSGVRTVDWKKSWNVCPVKWKVQQLKYEPLALHFYRPANNVYVCIFAQHVKPLFFITSPSMDGWAATWKRHTIDRRLSKEGEEEVLLLGGTFSISLVIIMMMMMMCRRWRVREWIDCSVRWRIRRRDSSSKTKISNLTSSFVDCQSKSNHLEVVLKLNPSFRPRVPCVSWIIMCCREMSKSCAHKTFADKVSHTKCVIFGVSRF